MDELQSEQKESYLVPISIFGAAIVLAGAWIYTAGLQAVGSSPATAATDDAKPQTTVDLPIRWNDLGAQLVDAGVIDAPAFEALYDERGGLSPEERALLTGTNNNKIVVDESNAGFMLNLLWAFGLGNKNAILENGPMSDPQYGGAENFASTGGWTLTQGNVMNHFSKHELVTLSSSQQQLVERVSKSIYRPCCDNATYFPDCNHGMAMLGLLELLAANNVSESDMYRYALAINKLWFPNQYATLENALGATGARITPKEMLGKNYSSASGYRNASTRATTVPKRNSGGGSCGV